jgi:5'-3' exonuclease
MSLRGAEGKPLKVANQRTGPMGFKPLFGTPQRFTTPDKANIIVVYDALNLFFTMSLAKQMGTMCTSTHIPSGQVFGTFRRIKANIKQFTRVGQRVALVFVWDNEPVAEKEILPEYKMNRDGHQTLEEEDLNLRMDSFRATLECLPCTFAEAPEEEADHVIATLVSSYEKPTLVMSSDKDLWPLMGLDTVKMVSMRKSEVITEAHLQDKFCLRSSKFAYKIALYKAVMGDASDNIPKVPRIPSKDFHAALNAIEYTESDDCVKMLMESASKLPKPKAHNLLVEWESRVRRNLLVTTLKENLEVETLWNPGSKEGLEQIFADFECQSFLDGGVHDFLFD